MTYLKRLFLDFLPMIIAFMLFFAFMSAGSLIQKTYFPKPKQAFNA